MMLYSVTPTFPNIKNEKLANRQCRLNSILLKSNIWDNVSSFSNINVNLWNKNSLMLHKADLTEKFHSAAIIGGSLNSVVSPYRNRKPNGLYLKSCVNAIVIRPTLKQILVTSTFPLPPNKTVEDLYTLPPVVNNNKDNKKFTNVHESLSYSKYSSNLCNQLEKPDITKGNFRLISEWGVLRGGKSHKGISDKKKQQIIIKINKHNHIKNYSKIT
eukprot:UN29891